MLIEIQPSSPDQRKIDKVAIIIKNGGVAIIPTDTIYAMVCDIYNHKAIDRVCRIKNVRLEKSNFSFLCLDLANISTYTRAFDRSIYKLLNRSLPGPYTFILDASNEVPSIFRSKKKTIGIRIPDNRIVRQIIEVVGNPLMSTSLRIANDIVEYPTDPYEMEEIYGNEVDVVVAGGYGNNIGSTIIDCTGKEPTIIREGAGKLDVLD